ncbi:hypothetical protein D9615_010088 [Tricholomella constricta]|uniref:Uncharacterized protein n=1 Tax=Tricholomella constricta TaxID=117010 RepID=A0A8H5LUS8_9AGAR|nr:hypothetical protein D9615_010088 [Tricholomella constricta]
MPGIRKLLELPFGPYPEDEILGEKFKKGTILILKSFHMECGRSPIGFDETEFIVSPPPTSRIAREATEFYGILEIEKLEWLSPQGKEWLQRDLRQRDVKIHSQLSASGLTLSTLYGNNKGEGLKLSVWIQGVKSMSARFMTERHPCSLIIHSKNNWYGGILKSIIVELNFRSDRMYDVRSLDVRTFKTSQNFLARYRLWALIDEIIMTDPDQTAVEKRTIDWLVNNYLHRFKERDINRGFFTLSCCDERMTRQRFLRHVPRAEVVGLFAAHADWLLAQQLAPNTGTLRKVNIRKWIKFCAQVATARLEASNENSPWGLPYGGIPSEDVLDLSRFGQTKKFWDNKIKNALKKSNSRPKPASNQALPNNDRRSTTKRRQPEFIYDSDFSEVSTSACSDSSDDEHLTSAESVPAFCLQPPTIPIGRFEWQCPGCNYIIDFLDLSEENTQALSSADARHLNEKSWKSVRDERVQRAFFVMVSDHYTACHSSRNPCAMPLRKIRNKFPKVKVEEEVVIIGYNNSSLTHRSRR